MIEIRLLPKSVSNKIAAGEVVERPLSVVKELVENAIDASASAISVDITGGGIAEICVTDNGIGIGAQFVQTAFEKHATSKIYSETDLQLISTQGFRGEALSSIAAVSVVEMKTKSREEELGTSIRISGGRLDDIGPAGLPDGTSTCVKNLFFNVPARLKFLKKPAQEAAYISDLISRYILAFPEVSFHYRAQGKSIFHSPGNGDLKSAIYCVYGGAVMDNLAHVDQTVGEITVDGYVSRPGTVMKNRRAGSVFVNRRYVRSTALHDMVRSAYGQTLVKGEFPFFALNITLPASSVDVNVHPNKLQVRFKDTAAVEHVLSEAVSAACTIVAGSVVLDSPDAPPKPKSRVEMQSTPDFAQEDLFSGFTRSTLKETEQHTGTNGNALPIEDLSADFPPPTANQLIDNDTSQDFAEAGDALHEYRLIGSFSKTYAIVEQGDSLLLIDQHAAHERLVYNQFLMRKVMGAQQLLSPEIITLSHEQKNLIDENLEAFISLGFDIAPFGELEYKVSAVPSVFGGASVSALLNDALFEIATNKNKAVIMRDRIIMAACRSAVKAGDPLPDQALASLVDRFLMTDVIPTCPHGRPIITVITKKQIEKSFKRTL